jgi:cell division septum initiation protein DivIVA
MPKCPRCGTVVHMEMDNEELGRKVRQLYNEFNKMMLKQGYDEVSLDEFLEWIEDMIDDPYN